MIQFPEKFQERMQQMLGDEEYAEFLKSYDLPFHNGLRINTWKTKPKELLQRMGVDLKQVPWNETGFYLENKKQFSKHPYYQGGLYYIQEASAMLPAKLVNAQPGEKILDMCAAPGGKSTAIGAALKGEGHFAAVLCRDADSEPMGGKVTLASVPKLPAEMESFFQFLETEGIHYPFDKKRLLVQNGYVQYIPEGMPELKGLHIMRSGWFLGELKKKRFEPSGAFARGLTPDVCEKVIAYPGDSEEVVRYLKCETLQVDPNLKNGWYLICVDEFALGWGKVSNGTLKNKYPSGWRLV